MGWTIKTPIRWRFAEFFDLVTYSRFENVKCRLVVVVLERRHLYGCRTLRFWNMTWLAWAWSLDRGRNG